MVGGVYEELWVMWRAPGTSMMPVDGAGMPLGSFGKDTNVINSHGRRQDREHCSKRYPTCPCYRKPEKIYRYTVAALPETIESTRDQLHLQDATRRHIQEKHAQENQN